MATEITTEKIYSVFNSNYFYYHTITWENYGSRRYDLYHFLSKLGLGTNLILKDTALWRWVSITTMYNIVNIPCNPFVIDML